MVQLVLSHVVVYTYMSLQIVNRSHDCKHTYIHTYSQWRLSKYELNRFKIAANTKCFRVSRNDVQKLAQDCCIEAR